MMGRKNSSVFAAAWMQRSGRTVTSSRARRRLVSVPGAQIRPRDRAKRCRSKSLLLYRAEDKVHPGARPRNQGRRPVSQKGPMDRHRQF